MTPTGSNRKLLVAALAAGLFGGLLATHLHPALPALAEKTAPAAKVVSAESFFIVDEQGKVRAALSLSPDNGHPTLVFLDKQGKTRLRVVLLSEGHPAVYVDGKEGQPYWYEP
jgi:hypothetical protein